MLVMHGGRLKTHGSGVLMPMVLGTHSILKRRFIPDVVKFVGQPGERATANMAVYYSDDAIIWDRFSQVKPVDETWTFQNASSTDKHRYWRFFFWDGYVTVGNILVHGGRTFSLTIEE